MIIAVEITCKKSGLLLFKHDFLSVLNESMKEIRAGAISAILNVLNEAFDKQQHTKIVQYGKFHIIVTEGYYSYGLLYVFEANPIQEEFLVNLVNKFEEKYKEQLEHFEEDFILKGENYFDFSAETIHAYNTLLKVDVERLSTIMELVPPQKVFRDVIIFSRPGINQIFTSMDDERYFNYAETVVATFKHFIRLEYTTPFSIIDVDVKLSRGLHAFVFNLNPYIVLVFVQEKDKKVTTELIKQIKRQFNERISNKIREKWGEEAYEIFNFPETITN